jgi:hypothetical protein
VPYGQASSSPPYQSHDQQQSSQEPQQFIGPELPPDDNQEPIQQLATSFSEFTSVLNDIVSEICSTPTPVQWETGHSRELLERMLDVCREASANLDEVGDRNNHTPMPPQHHSMISSSTIEPPSSHVTPTQPNFSITLLKSVIEGLVENLEEFFWATTDIERVDSSEDTVLDGDDGEADSQNTSYSYTETTDWHPPHSVRLIPGLISYDGMALYNNLSPEDRAVHNQNFQTETLDLRRDNEVLRRYCISHDLGVPPATLYEQAQLNSGVSSQSVNELYTSISPQRRAIHNRWIRAEMSELRIQNRVLRKRLEDHNVYVGRTHDEEPHPLRQYAIRVQRGRLCDDQTQGLLDWN